MTQSIAPITVQGIPASLLYSRASRITVGTVQVVNIGQQTGLDVWFQVKRSLKAGEPNTFDLKIWNLADSSRKALEQSSQPVPSIAAAPGAPNKVVPVKIEAGYEGSMATIFLGEMRSAQTVRDKDDLVTELQTGDGDEAAAVARVSQSFGPTNAYDVALALLKAMGSGAGNIKAFASTLRGNTLFQQGVTLKGNPKTILRDLAASVGLEFTIQSGQAQFLSRGQPIDGSVYELAPETGLIGEPSVDTKGVLSCMTLMLPGLRPGALVYMNSEFVQGTYRICSMETTGETASNDWGHKLEAKRAGLAP